MGYSHTTTRARPSSICKTCRRRKVRCNKERPTCHSCVRTKDICEYDDEQRKNPTSSDRANGSQGVKSGGDDWVNWSIQELGNRPSQSSNINAPVDQSCGPDRCEPDQSTNHPVIPLSSPYLTPSDVVHGALDLSSRSVASAGNMWHSHLTETDHTFSAHIMVQYWNLVASSLPSN